MANSAAVPSSLNPTDSAQNPYGMTPLPKPLSIQSPTYGTAAYNTALTNSGMTLNTKAQQGEMAAANPLMAPPKTAAPGFNAAQIASEKTRWAQANGHAPTPKAPTSAAAMATPPVKTPAQKAAETQSSNFTPSGERRPVPVAPTTPNSQPTQQEAGYFLNGVWQKPTDLRYSGYYRYGGQDYAPGELGVYENYATWVDPLPSPYASQGQSQGYYYGMPGQPG